jgi:hypothetical protein
VTALDDSIARVLFRRGEILGKLSSEMLNNPQMPKELKATQREEISFQLEDIAFEIQDKALKTYEEGYNYLNDQKISNHWKQKILEALKTLDPAVYTPKEVLVTVHAGTGPDWLARADSLPLWNKPSGADTLWGASAIKAVPHDTSARLRGFSAVGRPQGSGLSFLRRQFLLPGKVTTASVAIASAGAYKFFINGVPIAGDTSKSRNPLRVDSFDVKSFLKGGDNALCAYVFSPDDNSGFLMGLTAIIDTSLHYESEFGLLPPGSPGGRAVALPPAAAPAADTATKKPQKTAAETSAKAKPAAADTFVLSKAVATDTSAKNKAAPEDTSGKAKPAVDKTTKTQAAVPEPSAKQKPAESGTSVKTVSADTSAKAKPTAQAAAPPYYKEFKNYGEFEAAIADAQKRESEAKQEIKNVQTRIRGIKYRIRAVEDNLKATENDIKVYQKILEGKGRSR